MRMLPEHVVIAVLAVACVVGGGALLWALAAERHLEDAAEERLGPGAACGRPDHEAVLCVHAGRRYLCVRGRSGGVACAETFDGRPAR